MKVAVVGMGHVGLVTAATLARLGHEVTGVDEDAAKVAVLRVGRIPFFEPGLSELVAEERRAGRLRIVENPGEAIPNAEVVFVCVGTPPRPDGNANLLAVERASGTIGRHATEPLVVAHKSTVPVRTAPWVKAVLRRTSPHRHCVVSNPEFLREGQAVEDCLHPDRILVGSDEPRGHEAMRRLYAPLLARGVRYHETDIATAELAKHACNAFLALKISYANAVARLSEAAGADVVTIAEVMGSDPRIGPSFLRAGLGYGGYCLPKDVAAFRAIATRLGYEFGLLAEVTRINEEALEACVSKIEDAVWNLEEKRIALLGLSFKPGTDDVRDSPALGLARRLLARGATVVGYDPVAGAAAATVVPELVVCSDPYEAADSAHCLVICTEWPELAALDLSRLKGSMAVPCMVDGRNVFDPDVMRTTGFTYLPTGRPPVNS